MIEISPRQLSQEFPCPYIPGRIAQNEFFLAFDFVADELDQFFEMGWRKFGYYFFRPKCFDCTACNPIRVLVQKFELSRSQERVKKKNSDVNVKFSPLTYSDEIFDLYLRHSVGRFNNKAESKKEFIESFYNCTESAIQSEYYLDSQLVAVGFIDRSKIIKQY
jgi:arginine-tRNA-protein transferase